CQRVRSPPAWRAPHRAPGRRSTSAAASTGPATAARSRRWTLPSARTVPATRAPGPMTTSPTATRSPSTMAPAARWTGPRALTPPWMRACRPTVRAAGARTPEVRVAPFRTWWPCMDRPPRLPCKTVAIPFPRRHLDGAGRGRSRVFVSVVVRPEAEAEAEGRRVVAALKAARIPHERFASAAEARGEVLVVVGDNAFLLATLRERAPDIPVLGVGSAGFGVLMEVTVSEFEANV